MAPAYSWARVEGLAALIGSHLSRQPTVSPRLTKWWNWELMLATNFGSLCPKATNFGSQNFVGGGGGALRLSESVGMCRPLDPPFSPQEHPLVGYSNVRNTPVGYNFFVLSHSLWVIFVKFSYLVTLLGSFLWKFDTPVVVLISIWHLLLLFYVFCRAQRGSDRTVLEIMGWTARREMDHIEARWWKLMHWQ